MSTDLRAQVQRIKDIEDAILHIRKAMDELKAGKLTDGAIVILLKAMAPKTIKTNDIKWVLENLPLLADQYLKEDDEPQSQRKGKSK